MSAKTLLELSGISRPSINLGASTVILIDYQNEYLAGPLALVGAEQAVANAAMVLTSARMEGATIVHVAHKGGPSGPFDRSAHRGQIIEQVAPVTGELVIEKPRPNAFSGTNLAEIVGETAQPLIILGFMTHMCVSSTTRVALDLGYQAIVVGDACATRDLPTPNGDIAAADLHRAELAALADRFAWIFDTSEIVTTPTDTITSSAE